MQTNFQEEARLDVKNIYKYYLEEHGIDLAERFYSELKTKILFVENNPNLGSTRYSDLFENKATKFSRLKNFPYLFFYFVSESGDRLEILRMFHQSRDIENLID